MNSVCRESRTVNFEPKEKIIQRIFVRQNAELLFHILEAHMSPKFNRSHLDHHRQKKFGAQVSNQPSFLTTFKTCRPLESVG
jgi:hypothetical protein